MSYNTRRGAGNFNKGIPSSQVGQRRSGPNYGQGPPSQNFGNQQNDNHGYYTQQQGSRQQPPRQPSAQQQLAQQQQMLVQKKQQLAQQQKQVQQKQQMVQMKQAQQKQQEELELKKKKELEQQKQKELELQKQKELEIQRQKDLELQKAKEIELQRLKEIEMQQLELQKQKELELQRIKQEQMLLIKQEDERKLAEKEAASDQIVQEGEQMQVEEGVEDQPQISEGGNTESRPFRRRFPIRNRKLSKYEIQRRRNLRLGKILQPKSAMVILNEVGKNVTYNVERSQNGAGPKGYMFKATVVVDDTTHEGYGPSKASAKNEAAEKALRFLVKNKKLVQTTATETPTLPEGDEAMDTSDKVEKPIDIPLAWQQFASFAIYKLLNSWGEDIDVIKEDVKVEKKPAKKLPPNPELINPLMLMNQMLPRTNFVELPRTTNGAFHTFNFQAEVEGKIFNGNGASKKVAKRAVAFAICNEILGIQYPPEIYTPTSRAPIMNA